MTGAPKSKPKARAELGSKDALLDDIEAGLRLLWADVTLPPPRRKNAEGGQVEAPVYTLKDRLAVGDRLLKLAAIRSKMDTTDWGAGFRHDDDDDLDD